MLDNIAALDTIFDYFMSPESLFQAAGMIGAPDVLLDDDERKMLWSQYRILCRVHEIAQDADGCSEALLILTENKEPLGGLLYQAWEEEVLKRWATVARAPALS
jgi:hypothetical protein